MIQETPWLIIIGGPNGSGKTTTAFSVLPSLHLVEFLNADEIAKGLSPLNPVSVRIQAGKLLLERAHYLIERKVSIGFESTLAATTPKKLILEAKKQGFQVALLYFWLSSPELSMTRVQQRVKTGGHDIPESDVYRRYKRSIQNLSQIYLPLADVWIVFDNSGQELIPIAEGEQETGLIHVYNESNWQRIKKGCQP